MPATLPELLAFAGVLAIGQFSPGPDMLLLTQTSLHHGRSAGWWTTLGISSGITIHASLALFGWQGLLKAFPAWQPILAGVAGCYLLWLAWKLLKDRRAEAERNEATPESRGGGKHFFRRGLLCNLLNAKVLVFFSALVAPFLTDPHPAWWPWALWSIIVLEALLLWGLWVALLQHRMIRRFHARAATGINTVFALALAILGCLLLWEIAA